MRYQHQLSGCRPMPLAHYLKALGILRLVAEQADYTARGWWLEESFWLDTTLNSSELESFLLHEYVPLPAVAPWNGGSGFAGKDNQEAIAAIENSASDRFGTLRATIAVGRRLRVELGITDFGIKEHKDRKPALMQRCRDEMPEAALAWIDAAYVLVSDEVKYPPLLGTAGNDGRLDFTNNFMQRLLELFMPSDGSPTPEGAPWLRHALWGDTTANLASDRAIGQFLPGSAGGPNQTTGFGAKSLINPWDFVLMIEGSVVFAGAAVKRLGSREQIGLAYPFAVRPTSAGYASASDGDKARNELWLPLWEQAVGLDELRGVFAEGRARVGKRPAKTGVDFARAAAGLGVARGFSGFERVGFQERNGQATFAVSLGRVTVSRHAKPDLLQPLDGWIDKFLEAAKGDRTPTAILRAARQLERAIFDMCEPGGIAATQRVWLALAEIETIAAVRPKWFNEKWVRPVPLLEPAWLEAVNDGSVEFRLALALGSLDDHLVGAMRRHLAPVFDVNQPHQYSELHDSGRLWGAASLTRNLIAIARWRLQYGLKVGATGFAATSRQQAFLTDVCAFLACQVDDARLEAFIKAATLVNWQRVTRRIEPPGGLSLLPEAPYALIKLCHLSYPLFSGQRLTTDPAVLAHLQGGDSVRATQAASRRLRGNGWSPAIHTVSLSADQAARIGAAVLFPLSFADTQQLVSLVTRHR